MRVIKPGPRPAIAFGALFGLFIVIVAVLLIVNPSKNLLEGFKGIAMLAGGLGLFVGNIYFSRITVGDDYLEYRSGFATSTRIGFSEIDYSRAQVLTERSHPLFLDIFGIGRHEPRRSARRLRIRLKPFRKADVAWLLSLPQLRVRNR